MRWAKMFVNNTSENVNNSDTQDVNENNTTEQPESKQDIKVTVDMNTVSDSLRNINKTLLDMSDAHVEQEEDNNFYITTNSGNKDKILVDSNNNKMSNYDIFARALDYIDNGAKINLTREFVQYMRDYVDNVDKGGSPTEFMKDNIYRKVDLGSLGNINKF